MENDLQKASLWKRIGAGILDLILIVILATGFGWAISAISNYDSYNDRMEAKYDFYAQKYSLNREMTEAEYNALPEQERNDYKVRADAADAEIQADQEAMYLYKMVVNLILIIVSGGILLATILLEFVVPLIFGNGQTVGKKVFSLCVIRNDGVKLNGYQHFTRVILGKYAIETMIPVYVAVMLIMGQPNGILILFVAALLIAQCVMVIVTRNNCLLHDMMAGTVVADYGSQKIFKSTEDLIAYQKMLAADRARRQTY